MPVGLLCLSTLVFFKIVLRSVSGSFPEIFMEAGKIVKPAFVADLLHAELVVQYQLAGISNPDIV